MKSSIERTTEQQKIMHITVHERFPEQIKELLHLIEEHKVPLKPGVMWKRIFTQEDTEMPKKRCPTQSFQGNANLNRGCGYVHIRTALNKCQNKNTIEQKSQDQLVYKAVDGKIMQATLESKLFVTQSGMYLEQNLTIPSPPASKDM